MAVFYFHEVKSAFILI